VPIWFSKWKTWLFKRFRFPYPLPLPIRQSATWLACRRKASWPTEPACPSPEFPFGLFTTDHRRRLPLRLLLRTRLRSPSTSNWTATVKLPLPISTQWPRPLTRPQISKVNLTYWSVDIIVFLLLLFFYFFCLLFSKHF
jgi:hypothetical protein